MSSHVAVRSCIEDIYQYLLHLASFDIVKLYALHDYVVRGMSPAAVAQRYGISKAQIRRAVTTLYEKCYSNRLALMITRKLLIALLSDDAAV